MSIKPIFGSWCLAVLTSLALGSPAAWAQTWQDCAQENGICRFNGEARVRFGSGNQYAYLVATNRVICDAQEFGDASPGRAKGCQVLAPGNAAAGAGNRAQRWRVCANEGGECIVQGNAEVRFGTDGRYQTRVVQQRTACNTASFGDPAPGRVKQCEVLETAAVTTEATWRACATEGNVCQVTGSGRVRFGAVGRYETRDVVGSIDCSVRAFGDPAPGQPKQCDVYVPAGSPIAANASGNAGELRDESGVWDVCSAEGGTCYVRGKAVVRFGAQARWITREATNSVACDSNLFGDPIHRVFKSCYVKR